MADDDELRGDDEGRDLLGKRLADFTPSNCNQSPDSLYSAKKTLTYSK